MNIHYLQHVPFEGLGSMEALLKSGGHRLTRIRLYLEEAFPQPHEIDWLIVMGGPMGVHDGDQYPWLTREKAFISQVIQQGKLVLGICLGAQLIATVLGAQVTRSSDREIGWFDIERDPLIATSIFAKAFPQQLKVFHWHGETFAIPAGAVPLASSAACKNQGFIYDERVLALQFHLETTMATAQALIDHCADELDGSTYVQPATTMLENPERFGRINQVMAAVLDIFENRHRQLNNA